MREKLLCMVVVLNTFFSVIAEVRTYDRCNFKHEITSSGFIDSEVTIECYNQTEKVGFVCYTKIPLVSYYVLHSLYVEPAHRSRGYATKLLKYAGDYLTLQGASRIYIQPGPFEMDDSDMSPTDYELRLQQLITLYKNNQFVFVSRALQYLASLVYKCMGIDEDYHYLMVRILK